MSYLYNHVTLLRVIDGDTIQVAIDVGFRFQTVQTLRLLQLDTPERGQPGWAEARAKLTQLITGPRLKVQTVKQDSFGRWLSHIWTGDDLTPVSATMRAWMAEQSWSDQQAA